MTPALALAAGSLPVVARIGADDWGLIVFFAIAGLVRLYELVRGRKRRAPRGEDEPDAEDADEADDDAEVEAPARRGPARPHAPDPWRRPPAPERATAERRPPAPPRPVVHDQEGPDRTLVDLGAWKPSELGTARAVEAKAGGKPKPKAAPPRVGDARPVAGRALLLGNLTTPRDRMRAAVVWKEVLDRPRRLRMRRP